MRKLIKWLDNSLEESLMILALVLMTLVMGIQICARYLLNASLSWSEEVTRYLFIWSGFLSLSYCTKLCISIKIEQLTSMLKPRMKALVKVINHTIEGLFFIYLLPFAWNYMYHSLISGEKSPACGLPMYVVQSAPFICFALVAFRILQRWIIEFNRVRKGA